jgi:hypothetical protein
MEGLILTAILTPTFLWLGYETQWMTVILMVGDLPERELKFEPMYCRERSRLYSWRPHGDGVSYKIPARTIKMYGSTLNLYEGCNRCRAKLLKDIINLQKSHTKPHYNRQELKIGVDNRGSGEIEITIAKDVGTSIYDLHTECKTIKLSYVKPGMIKQAMKA